MLSTPPSGRWWAGNAAIPLITGLCCLAALDRVGIGLRLGRHAVRAAEARRFGGISSLVALGGIADLATYSLDRVILSANRGTSAVGFYEGPLQVQNMIRFLSGVVAQPVVPTARRFMADGDHALVRELFLKGLRYSLALLLPLVVVTVVLAKPIVTAWLGPSFAPMGEETAVFCAGWIVAVNGGMAGTMLAAGGHFRTLTTVSWAVASINLPIALLLTPSQGIWGPVAASVSSMIVGVALLFPRAMRLAGVRWGEVIRVAWLPAYSTAGLVAAALVALRAMVDVDGLWLTLGVLRRGGPRLLVVVRGMVVGPG